jgi:hypothetical protein
MVKTIIHTKFENPKISRLNEFFLVVDRIRRTRRFSRQGFSKLRSRLNPSGGGARPPAQTSSTVPPSANGSSTLPMQGISNPPPALSGSLARNSLSKEAKNAIQTPVNSAALSNVARCQPLNRTAQVVTMRSDGGSREGLLQQSPPTISPRDNSL